MLLTKHKTSNGSRWAVDNHFLPPGMNLTTLLQMRRGTMFEVLERLSGNESASGEEEAPIDPQQEVWAAGVTYLQSREARKAESSVADMYQKVYEAERPEIPRVARFGQRRTDPHP
jgi:2-dehydro-3-deoxy-D-arabinonate dehydratase